MPDVSQQGLSVTAHIGDRAVLLAFDMDKDKLENLAGFAVYCKPDKKDGYWLKNRLSFDKKLTKDNGLNSTPGAANYTDSINAPFQMFHWIHFPPEGAGKYTYDVTACYFDGDGKVKAGPKASLPVAILDEEAPALSVGMTRGYVSSQAFIDRFPGPAELWPTKPRDVLKKNFAFDTKQYQPKYQFLGSHGRELVFNFLKEAKSKRRQLDIFAYDFNEPDVFAMIKDIAKNATVRLYLDNSKTHKAPNTAESQIERKLKAAKVKVKRGCFTRFAHDKIFIMKTAKGAVKVLTGSANFSLRGLYVQSNSVLVFDDAPTAQLYEKVFEAVWNDAPSFKKSDLANKWWPEEESNHSVYISFAPHAKGGSFDSLQRPAQAIRDAKHSVLFAVMAADGGGAVIEALDELPPRTDILSIGTIEQKKQILTFKPSAGGNSQIVNFTYLKKNAPPPFHTEVDAGTGQHIHHKFVVVDFNGENPVVFCGSSNLAKGGEENNGDNLLAIYDRRIVTAYAIEAIRLFDHYRFRSRQENASDDKPLQLDQQHNWTDEFYDPKNMKCREREVFIESPRLPAGVTTKGPKIPIKAGAKPERRKTPRKPAPVVQTKSAARKPKR